MIDTKYLQLIVAIAEHGSLSKASRQLNLSASALSHQLKKFEEQLGVKIFYRVDNTLLFTEVGKTIKEQAEDILTQFNALETAIATVKAAQLSQYVHGYTQYEEQRLANQAASVSDALHYDTHWPAGGRILELGCGIGAQTEIIATRNPNCQFVAIDISESSLLAAQERIQNKGLKNVTFQKLDIRAANTKVLGTFDHVFVCFVLEHLQSPVDILKNLKILLKEGGTITLIEGDHGSTYFHPDSRQAQEAILAQVRLQQKRGGDAYIGRSLYPLLEQAGYHNIQNNPRNIYIDDSKPWLKQAFIVDTFTAMVKGMAEDLIVEGIIAKNTLEKGIQDLLNTAKPGGVFSYTFFKATATK